MPHLARMGRPLGERRKLTDQRRGSAASRGYGRAWQKAAAAFRRAYPFCGMRPNDQPPVMSECYDAGRYTIAAQVDHVRPHRGAPSLFWDSMNNWQSLCASCGASKSRAGL